MAELKGRLGDLFYRSLGDQPVARQLDVARRLGFAGIYVDRRGYPDKGVALIDEISRELKTAPALTRADGAVVFFRLNSPSVDLAGLSPQQIMDLADYRIDARGRYQVSLSVPLVFSQQSWPSYIDDVQGISDPESWGRWSDANRAPTVLFTFVEPLPANFTLVLEADAFGPNATAPTLIRIGDQSFPLTIGAAKAEFRIPVSLGAQKVNRIEIVPPAPTVADPGADKRRLGIGFVQMKIETASP